MTRLFYCGGGQLRWRSTSGRENLWFPCPLRHAKNNWPWVSCSIWLFLLGDWSMDILKCFPTLWSYAQLLPCADPDSFVEQVQMCKKVLLQHSKCIKGSRNWKMQHKVKALWKLGSYAGNESTLRSINASFLSRSKSYWHILPCSSFLKYYLSSRLCWNSGNSFLEISHTLHFIHYIK